MQAIAGILIVIFQMISLYGYFKKICQTAASYLRVK